MSQTIKLKLLTGFALFFLSYIFTYLSAQEIEYKVPHSAETGTRYSREEGRQHYFKGKEFYSQGRYGEARNEFERALESTRPPTVGITEKAPEIPETSLAPTLPTAVYVSKEELAKKEKEEKEKKEKEKKEAPLTQPTFKPKEREYYIDIGDVLDISVWQIPDLSHPEVIVRPDGKISFPLLGDVKAEGFTLVYLDDIITEKLKAYVKTPQVTIMLRRFGEQTNKIVILGEVLSPGIYKFSGPPTITEAVASAGGYTKYSVLNSIMVISGDVITNPEVTRVNLAQILKNGRLSQNIFLQPSSIVYVPRSFIGKVNTFLELIQPAISEYMQTLDARHFQHVMHRNK